MLLDVIEAEGEDFEDYFEEDFGPVLFVLIFFHVNDDFGAGYYLGKWTKLIFLLVDIVDAEEGTGESCGFAEGYQERGVDFSLRVDKDTAEEENQSTYWKDKSGY